jgi:two-component system response regulator YesN
MHNLLIVDDEPLITDSLAELFEEEDSFDVAVFKALSAKKALDVLSRSKIDVVITDICMPGLSGLELHDIVKHEHPKTRVVFLSVHDDFEYAQAAVRKDGVDFVLKTEPDERLFEAVRKAIGAIEDEKKQDQLVKDVRRQIKQALPFLWQDYLSRILQGIRSSDAERREVFEEYEIPLRYDKPCYLVLAKTEGNHEHSDYSECVQLGFGTQKVVNRCLRPRFETLCISTKLDTNVWFLQEKSGHDGEAAATVFLSEALGLAQQSIGRAYSISFSVATTARPVRWEDMSRTYDLLEVMLAQVAHTPGALVTVDMNKPRSMTDNATLPDAEREVLSQLKKMPFIQERLESGHEQEFSRLFGDLRMCVLDNQPLSPQVEEQVYYSIGLAFLACINRAQVLGNRETDLDLDIEVLHGGVRNMSWSDRFQYFEQLAGLVFAERRASTTEKTDRCVRILHEYIGDHLDGDLSVVRLGDVVNLNPSYLSRMYKQCTGTSLSEYIAARKIDRATELLAGTNLRVVEIAQQLGFSSGSYFSRFFKKYANSTPEEYRLSLG